MPEEALGAVYVALSAVQFGLVVVLGKVATNRGVPVASLLSIRFGIAAVLLGAGLVAARRPLRAARGEGIKLLVLGSIGYGVEATLFFLAIERGTASAVTLLFFVYPVIVAGLSVLAGVGMPTKLVGASLCSAVAGVALVVGASGTLDVSASGIAFALSSATMFAFYLLGAERTLKRTSSVVASMWVSAAAAAAIAVYAFASGTATWPSGGHQWWPVIGTGIFTSGAFFALFAGLRRLGAVRTSIIAALEPFSAATLAVIFLGDPVRAGTIVGGVLILAGAVSASIARGRKPEPETSLP
ncbi:MAG: DMT family transporter [Actinomycetota bacterium]